MHENSLAPSTYEAAAFEAAVMRGVGLCRCSRFRVLPETSHHWPGGTVGHLLPPSPAYPTLDQAIADMA